MNVHKKRTFIFTFILVIALTITGCSSKPVEEQHFANLNTNNEISILEGNHFELLQKATDDMLKASSLESITVDEVYQKVVLEGDLNYFVVDVRSPESFAAGSIDGAVNIPYEYTAKENMIATLPTDKKIIVVCYSGHTASQTAALWSMLGYDAVPMLNGMGGWKEGAGSALPKEAFDFPVTTLVPEENEYELLSFASETAVDLNSLIMERSSDYISSGKGPVINATQLKQIIDENNDDYFFIDIRGNEDYHKGHITGSINIPYKNIADLDNLKRIPSDKKVVLIGYDGNDASQVARLLNQLGYDTYAMFQGMRVWTSDEGINGIKPISTEIVPNYPIIPLEYDLDGGGGGSASCG